MPVYNFVVAWRTCKSVGTVVDDRDELALFLAFSNFFPAFVGVVQGDINAVKDGRKE